MLNTYDHGLCHLWTPWILLETCNCNRSCRASTTSGPWDIHLTWPGLWTGLCSGENNGVPFGLATVDWKQFPGHAHLRWVRSFQKHATALVYAVAALHLAHLTMPVPRFGLCSGENNGRDCIRATLPCSRSRCNDEKQSRQLFGMAKDLSMHTI